MSRNYPRYTRLSAAERADADSRNTDLPVMAAINAISSTRRHPESIWAAPTQAEWEHVEMCLNEWARLGDIECGPYCWGSESITAEAA